MLQGDIKSFYNLEALLNILSTKRYPFVQPNLNHILPEDIKETVYRFRYVEAGEWSTLHLAHNIPVTGTEAENHIPFIARAFLDELILNYDEAKELSRCTKTNQKEYFRFYEKNREELNHYI